MTKQKIAGLTNMKTRSEWPDRNLNKVHNHISQKKPEPNCFPLF